MYYSIGCSGLVLLMLGIVCNPPENRSKLEGWLARKHDPIEPSILMHGITQLVAIFHAYESYRPLIEEALQHPEILDEMFGITLDDA